MKRSALVTGVVSVAGLIALFLPMACSETRAQPLEVTYYYLPG